MLLLIALWPLPLAAQQEEGTATAEQALETASSQWSTSQPQTDPCADVESSEDVIVVCRQWEDGAAYTFDAPTRADSEVTGSGAPRAPDLFGLPPCETQTVCISGLGSVPPPAIMVDFSALPETPAGSDAARLYGGPTDADMPPAPEGEPVTPRDPWAEAQAAMNDDVIGP